jgi:hypothetical protein
MYVASTHNTAVKQWKMYQAQALSKAREALVQLPLSCHIPFSSWTARYPWLQCL